VRGKIAKLWGWLLLLLLILILLLLLLLGVRASIDTKQLGSVAILVFFPIDLLNLLFAVIIIVTAVVIIDNRLLGLGRVSLRREKERDTGKRWCVCSWVELLGAPVIDTGLH
jgi:hypothetical protein